MLSFPHCKINLGLHVVAKRADGYHDIQTCFYPVEWNDVLEILPSSEDKMVVTGMEVPGDVTKNLVWKAVELLRADFAFGPVQAHLHKAIPFGAGLGGGSADGAFALRVLNDIFNLQISTAQLQAYALKLGSDCPFFIKKRPFLATGRGEALTPIEVDLSDYQVLVVKPGVAVSTAEAYASIVPKAPSQSIHEILKTPVATWRETLTNDFEPGVFRKYPEIKSLKDKLYHMGATYASMSGSGSAVFGLFPKETEIGAMGEEYVWKVVDGKVIH